MNTGSQKDRIYMGTLCVIGSALMFSLAGASAKTLTESLPNETIVFWRHAISFMLLAPWAYVNRKHWFKRENSGQIVAWALAALTSLYCYYYAIATIPLADAALLSFSAPIFVPIIGFLLFRFALDKQVLSAMFVGFLGVALVLQPDTSKFEIGTLVGLLSGVFGGLAVVLLWRMTCTETSGRMTFFFSLIGVTIWLIPVSMSGQWPEVGDWTSLLILGVCSTLAILLISLGCLIAPTERVITFDYSGVLFASILGWILWDEQIHLNLVIGGSLIVGAGIYVIRSKPRNRQTDTQRRTKLHNKQLQLIPALKRLHN